MDRRTQENFKEKVQSSRISRLVQPRKYSATPNSLIRNRSSSIDNVSRYNQKANKRSRSATPHMARETPVRPTIARSLSSLFTPASTSKNVTSRKHTNDQATRILQVLRRHFGPTYLTSGLHSMTAKQFIEIIRFFAQNICGGQIVIQDNNVDDVKRFIDFIEYPHQMNKSWFKAPTVSIAYERNVEFLGWLCDFVTNEDGDSIDDDLPYKVGESDHLVDQQFDFSFFGDLRNGFVIWSDRTAEFDKWKLKWIGKMITAKTALGDIDASIERVKHEYEILHSKESSSDNEHLLKMQQRKCDELEAEVSKRKTAFAEKEIDFRETTNELNREASQNEKLISRINGMKETINSQKFSANDRFAVITDSEQKIHVFREKRAFVDALKLIADDHQIKIARLKRQKTSAVFRLNSYIQKLFQIGIGFGELTTEQLSINETDTKDEIKTKMELLTQIKEIVNQRRLDVNASMIEINSDLASISNELFVVEDEIAAHKKHLHSVEVQIQKINNKIVEINYDSEQRQQQLETKIDNLLEDNEQIKLKIEIAEKSAKSLKDENEKIFQGIQLKTDALLKAKRERQARQEAAILELEQVAEQLKDSVKFFK